MDKKQKGLIKQLRDLNKQFGHSPKRREITPELSWKCYKYFGSFNEAKKKAGLKLVNVKILDFPKEVFKIDKDMAAIASYLTFDGHLYKDLKGFMYSSKNIKDLKEFEKIIKRKFGNLREIYHLNSGRGGIAHKVYFFNKTISEELFKLGVPKGDKSIQKFNVPVCISSSKELSREYLKIAFFCEGSFKEEAGRTPRIIFTQSKWEDILDSGLKFMNTLRMMLKKFDINTKECFITSKRIRKRDGKITRDIRFRVEIKDNNKFIKKIGWLK